jgi:uncharacterized protein YodC (DUF2158 family)
MECKYKAGEIVKERIRPSQKLLVKRYFDGMYYCAILEHASLKLLVFFERELMPDRDAAGKNLYRAG